MSINDLNKQLERILESLSELTQINQMANKQGNDELFTYYTLDNEFYSHNPHVHICVSNNDKHWNGKPLRSGNHLKTIASVTLYITDEYTIDNIEFEEIIDKRILSNEYKKVICKWLNTKKLGYPNWVKCINDYVTNNPDFHNYDIYYNYIKELG